MSKRDIHSGARWGDEVADGLYGSDIGVICLTKENLSAPWLLFEAGAISKKRGDSSVNIYLLGLEAGDITGPLSQFQSVTADEAGTLDMVTAINQTLKENAEPTDLVKQRFEAFWPKLKKKIKSASENVTSKEVVEQRIVESPEIFGEEGPAPTAGVWYKDIRPVLHQAIHYTVPTYYLDVNLMVVDWNLAFDLVFSRLGGTLRNKHVKHFIAELDNFAEVMDHAQDFTRQVSDGNIPFIDVEPLRYGSEKYGLVSFLKVAAQLHHPDGRPAGWSVSLIIREIDWNLFDKDLLEEARKDKLWGVYSASYDRVLLQYPPYKKLIQDVIAVVPENAQSVLDLGAGTGNVTAALLKAGYIVTAVENNLGMLDRLRSKSLPGRLTVMKSSIQSLATLTDDSFDSAVMVNALYAVDDPLACLQEVHRVLGKDGVLGLSTTHSDTKLDPLLNNIKSRLKDTRRYDQLSADFQVVHDVNKQIEVAIARQHTRDEYREWIKAAGFDIVLDVPSTYSDAVMLIHAKKK
jgi:ubiquinone/menaquinone biosynthesis C-methylase UbiE